jgi:hypothetical protein
MSDDVLESEKADTQAGRLAVVAQAGAQAARQRCEEILEKIKAVSGARACGSHQPDDGSGTGFTAKCAAGSCAGHRRHPKPP